jgi:fibronectin-binding autotransporter adhesin
MKKLFYILFGLGLFMLPSIVSADSVSNANFESGDFTGWEKGAQTENMTSTITGSGTGVSIINGTVTFNAPPGSQVGTPGSQYYQPATPATIWQFSPYGSHAAALQPANEANFDVATLALGLSSAENTFLRGIMTSQASASGWGSGNPTDAAWITRNVTLSAGVTYTMSWNYIGTDYVPFNDGSITSLTPVDSSSSATITVNNQTQRYALLGFTNPGTGDYSTGTYGSTGWQVSTYQVSVTGDYKLGFAVFNLDDTALSPVLLIDSQPGGTTKNGESFGAVPPNNPDAPTVPPTPTDPPATDPPATDPPATDPPATDPPATDPPVTDPPIEESTTTTTEPVIDTTPEPSPENDNESTTTVVDIPQTTVAPPSMPETTVPIGQLPNTGNSVTIFYAGVFLCFVGYLIIIFNKRMNENGE